MAKKASAARQKTGLYHAREARGMSRTELVGLSGISKQQLSRLENGNIRLRLDHLKPFAPHLGYTPEQMLLWGRFPGTGDSEVKAAEARRQGRADEAQCSIPEIDTRAEPAWRGVGESYSQDRTPCRSNQAGALGISAKLCPRAAPCVCRAARCVEVDGDSMAPTIMSGDHVVVDTGHTAPTPDGLYAIRDTLKHIAVKRLQLLRSTRPPRVKIISANPNHATEEVPISDLEIVGKVVCFVRPL